MRGTNSDGLPGRTAADFDSSPTCDGLGNELSPFLVLGFFDVVGKITCTLV